MARFTAVSAILYVLGRAISYFSPNSIFTILEGLGTLGLLISFAYYTVQVFKHLRKKWLWKIRNKIIVSYAFVGLIPMVILGLLLWLILRLVLGQLAALYLDAELEKVTESLRRSNFEICLSFYQSEGEGARVELLTREALGEVGKLRSDFKNIAWRGLAQVRRPVSGQQSVPVELVAEAQIGTASEARLSIPKWALRGYSGLTQDRGKLYFRSIIPIQLGRSTYFSCLEVPFDEDMIAQVRTTTDMVISRPVPLSEVSFSAFGSGTINYIGVIVPTKWENGQPADHLASELRVPFGTVYNHYFTETGGLGEVLFLAFWLLGSLFVIVEVSSLVIAIFIGRSITRTIHAIDEATANIRQGNFDYRIPTNNRDQLEAMAASFNNMSESIVGLMQQVTEKQRLDKEIEIAREVQAKLFPQKLPTLRNLQLAAACLPARQVSGDYYDFIPSGPELVDVVIGDISGKGISAALLMASLQSSFRTIISYQAMNSAAEGMVARSVVEINRQLYQQTSPDKFATLVLGRFNAGDLTLTYCNAGHNPPLRIAGDGSIDHLSVGGMVAGLFEDPEYEEETLQLRSKDMVVFYTDGIVEAENPAGEQFGEDRLAELLTMNSFLTADDLQALILDQLSCWVAGGDQRDDMTVVIVKID